MGMIRRTPPIETAGLYVVESPFTLVPKVLYTCSAIDSFTALAMRNVDVYAKYYEPNSISKDIFDKHVLMNANIVFLRSETHPTVPVPDTFITSFPDMSDVPYCAMVIGLELGSLPDALNLDDLETRLKELCMHVLGVTASSSLVRIPTSDFVSISDHRALEQNRIGNMTIKETDLAVKLELKGKNQALSKQLSIWEAIAKKEGWLP